MNNNFRFGMRNLASFSNLASIPCISRTRFLLPCIFVFLAGCNTAAIKTEVTDDLAKQEVESEAKIVKIEPVRPKIPLSEDILYKLLVAEIAGQRGALATSVQNYIELARMTNDPKIIERAARIAVYARDNDAASEMADMWVELDPLNSDPHQVLAVMALRKGEKEKALEHLQSILKYSHGEFHKKLWMIANLLGREKDKELALNVMEALVANQQDDSEAIYAYAHVAARLGDLRLSRVLLEQTLALAPENDNAAMSYISVLQRLGQGNDAINWLTETLAAREGKGNNFNLRMAYARLLTDAKRFADARRQFEILSVQAPNNTEVSYALGLLYLQANRLSDSERYFRRLAEKAERSDDASYYLGRIEQERKEYDKASAWYKGVQQGENYFDAQVRLAMLFAKMGQIDKAREHLHSIRTQGEKQSITLIQAEGELLTEEKRYDEAIQVYDDALRDTYNTDLLYSRAMLAERMGRLDIMEEDLRRILVKEPNNAQALNALGYTLADQTDRYQEALELIQRALEISPDDFYILDSMGWVLYRMGRLGDAIIYLRRALTLRADPEIAAHLGEVLWVIGDKEGAKAVWDTALQETPEDSRLLDVIKRFNP